MCLFGAESAATAARRSDLIYINTRPSAKDPIILSALMAELAQNPDLRKKMGKNARTRTINLYPPAEPKYLEIYTKMK